MMQSPGQIDLPGKVKRSREGSYDRDSGRTAKHAARKFRHYRGKFGRCQQELWRSPRPTGREFRRARGFGGDPTNPQNRMRAGAMLQVGRVPETLRVREHIDLFSSYYSKPLPLEEVLAAAGLEKLRERKFGDLSGGQRQRTLFALAICGDPDLLFLDEPTVGLDVEARRALWEEIRHLVDFGKTVVLT